MREAAHLTGLGETPGFGPGTELRVILVGERTITRLNRTFFGRPGPTDVIAFPLAGSGSPPPEPGERTVSGEVYVCLPVAREAAARCRSTLARECILYAVHGMLHLAGLDDADPAGRRAMRRAEARILGRLRDRIDFDAIFGEGTVPGPRRGDARHPPAGGHG